MIYLNWAANQVPLSTLTASSNSTGYVPANLKTRYVPETWRSAAAALTPNVKLDFGSALSFDFLAVINHNLRSTGTVIVKGGSSVNPDGSEFQTPLLSRAVDRFRRLPAPQSFRYLTFEFSDVGNPDNFIEAGLLLVGLSARTPMHFAPDWELGHTFLNRDQLTDGGVALSEEVNDYWTMMAKFDGLSEDEFDEIYDGIHEASHGSLYPLFVIPRESKYFGCFMRLTSPARPKRFHYNTFVAEFREETRGIPVGA